MAAPWGRGQQGGLREASPRGCPAGHQGPKRQTVGEDISGNQRPRERHNCPPREGRGKEPPELERGRHVEFQAPVVHPLAVEQALSPWPHHMLHTVRVIPSAPGWAVTC